MKGKKNYAQRNQNRNRKLQRNQSIEPIEDQIEGRFEDIKEEEGLYNTADATVIQGAQPYQSLSDQLGEDAGGRSYASRLEDTVTAIWRNEREDRIARGEMEMPPSTEDQALGDRQEDSDEPLRNNKPM